MDEKDEVLQGRKRIFAWFLQDYINAVDADTKKSLMAQLPYIWANNDSSDRAELTKAVISVGRLVARIGSSETEDLSTLAEIAKNGKLFLYPSGNWPEPLGEFVAGALDGIMDGLDDWESMQKYNPGSFRSRLAIARADARVVGTSATSPATRYPVARLRAIGRRILQAFGITPMADGTSSIQP